MQKIFEAIRRLFSNDLVITKIEAPKIENHVQVVTTVKSSKKEFKPFVMNRYESWRDVRARIEPTKAITQNQIRDKFLENFNKGSKDQESK